MGKRQSPGLHSNSGGWAWPAICHDSRLPLSAAIVWRYQARDE